MQGWEAVPYFQTIDLNPWGYCFGFFVERLVPQQRPTPKEVCWAWRLGHKRLSLCDLAMSEGLNRVQGAPRAAGPKENLHPPPLHNNILACATTRVSTQCALKMHFHGVPAKMLHIFFSWNCLDLQRWHIC